MFLEQKETSQFITTLVDEHVAHLSRVFVVKYLIFGFFPNPRNIF